ncbi:MAG: hypothetical protein R2754_01690 [Microthrixaceae bacterium]
MSIAVDVHRGLSPTARQESLRLAADNPFDLRSNYRSIGIDRAGEAAERCSDALDDPRATTVAVTEGGVVVAFAVLAHDGRLSSHFELGCWSVRALAVDRSGERAAPAAALAVLARAIWDAARDLGADHLSVRTASDDFALLAAFQAVGFAVCDTQASYLLTPRDPASELRRWRQMGEVEVTYAVGEEIAELPPVVGSTMSEVMGRHYNLSRFHADPRFDDDRASVWYGDWCRRVFTAERADGVMVAMREQAPVGFISWEEDPLAPAHQGLTIFGSGLGASLGHGAYSAMVDFAEVTPIFDHAEFDVHINNFPVNRVLARHPAARVLRVSHALHAWLDRGEERPPNPPG